jgi:serine/threonine protein kinase
MGEVYRATDTTLKREVARIRDGPIPADEAMGIAMQIVAALEAAHERGTVHRDLKPANVKVKDDGTVKVLDFGISKPIDPATISGGTLVGTTPAVTQTGVILGTAAYMSPEQARGDDRISADGPLIKVPIQTDPVLEIGEPELVADGIVVTPLNPNYAHDTDADRWLVYGSPQLQNRQTDFGAIVVVENWVEWLKREVPVE